MKGGIAAALVAAERLVLEADFHGRLWFLITSDEEGEADYGSREIVKRLKQQGVSLDYCLVGEPSSTNQCGDTLKIGRRGALSFDLKIPGKSGHVAYPAAGINAIHLASQVVNTLLSFEWGKGDQQQPCSTLQITHIDSGKWSDNVIPDLVTISFNIRYTSFYSKQQLLTTVETLIKQTTDQFHLETYRHCAPYYSNDLGKKSMLAACKSVIHQHLGLVPKVCSSGGTSDGRFFSEICTQVIELGVTNSTIHQENERIHISELDTLGEIYYSLFSDLLQQQK